MNADSRGIPRGQCTVCSCACNGYSGGESGLKCLNCAHPPGKHVNLSSAASSGSLGPSQLQAAAVPPDQSISSSSGSHPSFTLGPRCQVPGCTQEAHFDLNTRSEYSFCLQHQMAFPQLQTWALTNYEDPGATFSPFQPQPLSLDPTSSLVPPQSLVSLPQQQQPVPQYGVQDTLSSQSVPNFAALQSSPQQTPWQPPQAPQGPPPLQAPAVPPHQQCKLPGCRRMRCVENGRMHDCCGRTHAHEYMRQQAKQSVFPAELRCQTQGCPRPKRKKDDGSGYFDYCSLTCRDTGQMRASASVPKDLVLQEKGRCSLPGCTRLKYVDPANNRVHDFCGRTHASEAQKRGISGNGVSIRMANARELQVVSAKFQKDWVKGTCLGVTIVFIITNTPLEKRYDAYRQKLSNQTREEHYHGTKLKCNITRDKRACSDSDCGVCGISSMGLDRRCIQKNINFQRFGHGFYLAPNSSKCHDYTQGAHNFRAMLLCEVAPGNKYSLKQNDPKLKGPPKGYDSVYGTAGSASVLNYDEIVVYNPDCILPRYIIVYQKDGIQKIAQ